MAILGQAQNIVKGVLPGSQFVPSLLMSGHRTSQVAIRAIHENASRSAKPTQLTTTNPNAKVIVINGKAIVRAVDNVVFASGCFALGMAFAGTVYFSNGNTVHAEPSSTEVESTSLR